MNNGHSSGPMGEAAHSLGRACARTFARLSRRGVRFLVSRRGNTAIIFGLAAIPLFIAAGCAIDLSRALIVRQRLAQALDAAGLAIARDESLVNQQQLTQAAQDFFKANYPTTVIGTPSQVTVTPNADNSVFALSATARVDTAIMRIVGIDYLTVGVSNEITRSTNGLELALVLDTTGSMGQPMSKIDTLKTAAHDLVDKLFGPNNSPNIKVGVVPFAEAVRLDTATLSTSWIDTQGLSSIAHQHFSAGNSAYCVYSGGAGCGTPVLVNTPWPGCVEARPNGLEETDDAPGAGDPDTLWEPMFQPDEPHVQNTENGSWNPAAPNQGGLSSSYQDDYISLDVDFSNQNFTETSLTVNSLNTSTDVLTLSASHGFATGDGPINLRTTGTLPGPGITATTPLWIINVSGTTIKLATSQANALAGTFINFTSAGSGNSLSYLTANTHGYTTGDGVRLSTTNTLPGGLATGTDYWVIKLNNNRFRLATSSANATGGTGINMTSGGSGTHSVPKVYSMTDTFTYGTTHLVAGETVVTGDGPVRVQSTATIPGGLAGGTDYWFIVVNGTTMKLATSRANALANIAVDITGSGAGTMYTAESPGGTTLNEQRSRQQEWRKYTGKTYSGTSGPLRACAMQPVLALTNDKQAIFDKITALNPSGNTHIPLGLAWGWRVLSPTPPFTEGAAYDAPLWIKALVLMTDGENTVPTESSTLNASRYTAYSYASEGRLNGATTSNAMETEIDASLTRTCNNVKATGIRVYTVAFTVTTQNVKDLLQGCASDPSLYYDAADEQALLDAFAAIAEDLSRLRLSK